jgi:hypothetical protein
MPRLSLLCVLAAALVWAATVPNLPAQLTLSEALNIALSNSTNIREALARLDQALLWRSMQSTALRSFRESGRTRKKTTGISRPIAATTHTSTASTSRK